MHDALAETIRRSDADVVVSGTPFDLEARVRLGKPIVRATYDLADVGEPTLGSLIDHFLSEHAKP